MEWRFDKREDSTGEHLQPWELLDQREEQFDNHEDATRHLRPWELTDQPEERFGNRGDLIGHLRPWELPDQPEERWNQPGYNNFEPSWLSPINADAGLLDDFDWSTLETFDTEVCFGEIRNVPTRFIDDQKRLYIKRTLETNSSIHACTLDFVEDRCQLVFTEGDIKIPVSVLTKKACGHLISLRDSFALRFHAIFSIQCSKIVDHELLAVVGINVYGLRSRADKIADAFCAAGYFLQDPFWKPDDTVYENPQLYELDIHQAFEAAAEGNIEGLNPIISNCKYVKPWGIDFGEVLDDFAQPQYLHQVIEDDRIQTPLLNYQRQGLDFILRRESNRTSPESSLWIRQDPENGGTSHLHCITGARSETPKETIGGILADDMGLGKSLTMLSAILASTENAWKYACSKVLNIPDGGQFVKAARSTLIVVPSQLILDGWVDQIKEHIVPGKLSVYKYHGHRRNVPWSEVLKNDIVLTTYGTVVAEQNRSSKLLFEAHWYRIVLDEAHVIRNSSTSKFRAVCRLQSLIRWCLSGTPIQNNIEDLGSLVTFLRTPFLEEPAQFRRHISNKIQLSKDNLKSDFKHLHALLRSICLRRNKTFLPQHESIEETCLVHFSQEEKQEYDRMAEVCLENLNMAMSGHNVTQSHQTVLEAILRLRIFCNNGTRFQPSWSMQEPEEAFALLQQRGAALCHYCGEEVAVIGSFPDLESAKMTKCKKLVCAERRCQDMYGYGIKGGICPLCKEKHGDVATSSNGQSLEWIDSVYSHQSTTIPSTLPTKLKRLCDNIRQYQNSEKSIVFSFWKQTLNIVGKMFLEQGIRYLQIDGDVPFARRKKTISEFQRSSDGMVLIMTLGIGAVGLNNLSVASQIHILEPQWNPAVESQAIGRVVRLGQKRTVRIVRYLVRGTVERSVRDRQHLKLQLLRAGVNEGKVEGGEPMRRAMKELIHPDDRIDDNCEMEM